MKPISTPFLAALALLTIPATAVRATPVTGPEVHFTPDVGQPIFPAGNINVFKQFVLDWQVSESVGDTTRIPFLGTFGADISAELEMAFGLEMGLCFGGNANFDLGFRPTITLPDRYPTEVPIPLTVAAGLTADSNFTTTFPPLGKAYADLIMHAAADLQAQACVFGCVDFGFDFSTCDIPALPDGTRLFKESTRCDPTLTQKKYCAIELASFNRDDDNAARMINVTADNIAEFLSEPYLEFKPELGTRRTFTADAATDRLTVTGGFAPLYGGAPVKLSTSGTLPAPLTKDNTYYIISPEGSSFKVALRQGSNIGFNLTSAGTGTHKIELNEPDPPDEPVEGNYGSVCIAVPTVETDSADSEFNTCEVLKSTGAEDILSVKLDVAALVSDFLLPPPPFPRLSDSDSFGPLSYHYTIASLEMGPSVQLQTDFEMTWDLVVQEVTFTVPGSPAPGTPRNVKINGQVVNKLSQVAPAGRVYHFTNCFPPAGSGQTWFPLPHVELITATPVGAAQLPVQVTITYKARPKLKTVVSTPFYGNLEYKALEAGVDVEYIGGLGFGPLIEGDHKFKFGEFTVYDGNPSPINAAASQMGSITFQMLAAGPPKFAWRPSLLSSNSTFDWSQLFGPGALTNWLELVSGTLNTAFPGMNGNTGSDVRVDVSGNSADDPTPTLYDSRTVASMQVMTSRRLDIKSRAGSAPVLTVGGGLLENSGTIEIDAPAPSGLKLNSRDAVLCGTGVLFLHDTTLSTYAGPESSTFSNYNTIYGTGTAVDSWDAARQTTVNNMGFFVADPAYARCVAGYTLTLNFDNYPEETSWEITNGQGVVASSNGLAYAAQPDGSTLNIPVQLPEGNYTLRVMDSASDGMCCGFGNGSFTLRSQSNAVAATGSSFGALSSTNFTVACPGAQGLLTTSATTIINQNTFTARAGADGNYFGGKLDTRAGSKIRATGDVARQFLSFQTAEHAGLIRADGGGTVHLGPFFALHPRSTWNAGQSFTNDTGYFRSEGINSVIEIQDTDITGGCFLASTGGAITAQDSTFTGSVFHIGVFNPGTIDPASGSLTLNSAANQFYTGTSLSNYGTVHVPGQADFVDNVMFSNNGTIAIPAGGVLRIREKTMNTAAPGAAPETRVSPGAANATRDTLLGGTWDVTGSLYMDGAYFKAIGANAAHAATSHGSVDGDGIATGADEDDETRVLSLRAAGKVWLRGADWLFPALTTLEENRGSFCLAGGAVFPRALPNTVGHLTNKGIVRIEAGSRINVGGSYIQKGARSSTDIIAGSLISSTNNFQILGGTLTANSASTVFNRSGNTIPSGTTIRVESPLIDTNEVDPFGNPLLIQEPVTVTLQDVQITSIAAGANVTVHGAAVRWQSLTENLTSNAGTLTVSGDGIDNAGTLGVGPGGTGDFTNTGRLNVLGSSSEFSSTYTQSGAAAVTEIGGGAMLRGNSVSINAGQLIMDIETRPFDGHYATIEASNVALNNRMVINFTGKLGLPGASVDTGDTWELARRTVATNVTGFGTVAYTFNGGPLPADFLPPGTHLEVLQFPTSFGPRGLGLRVVPNGGFQTYDAWAISKGYPSGYRRNPYQDFDNNGRTNGFEFLFGPGGAANPPNGTVRDVLGTDGETYREYIYLRAAGNHDAIYKPFASTDNINWREAPMSVMEISPVAGTSLEQVVLRSNFPATSERVYYRLQADFNPDNFADNSGAIPAKPISGANGLENLGYVPGQILFFNVNAPNAGNFDSVWGSNTPPHFYRDRSSMPTAALHARILGSTPGLSTHGIVQVTFFPHQLSFIGIAGGGNSGSIVTSQPWSVAQSAGEPNAISYRLALAGEFAETALPGGIVNFISANANLAALDTSDGTLTPEFSSAVTAYTLGVPQSVTSITLTATPADGTATLLLNGVLPLTSGVASNPVPINSGNTLFTVNVTAQSGATRAYTINVTRLASDYAITTTGNAIVVTDIAGFSDTLDIFEPAAGNILFVAAGRTFQVNGGTVRTGDSGNLTRTGMNSITVNAATGVDSINVGNFTGTLPALTLNGGLGNDSLYFTGDITFAANASLDADLQNDSATPGNDLFLLSPDANLLTSGTGTITVKVSRTVKLTAGSSLETVNGGIILDAGLVATSAALNAIDLDEGTLRTTGTGNITLIADSMILSGPVIAGAVPVVTLRQKSATTSIGLGANDVAGRLGLTDTELDFITAAKLTIGDTFTPTLTLSAPISRAAATALTLITNTATGTIVPSGPGTDLDLGTGGALTIGGPGAGLGFGIAGLTADTQYSQMKVLGTVNLNNARLFLSSTLAAPAAGNAFTLVDNDGTDAITGTFAGVAQGTLVPWPGSSTLVGRVVYNGGTGNDVVLTLQAGTIAGFAAWANTNIPAGQDATFAGDWNRDGIPNGVQYVFGTTRLNPTGKGRVPAPPAIPADVDIFLDRSLNLTPTPGWAPVVSWVNGTAPTFASGLSIVTGEVRDTITGPRAFYRYRVVKR